MEGVTEALQQQRPAAALLLVRLQARVGNGGKVGIADVREVFDKDILGKKTEKTLEKILKLFFLVH